ncbi:MAG: bifunctional UDP-N-acetylglucosamine diphosphorylase/glucosamine-1-phosphate N-acetyltransferase GlmU [Gammaproteobacteria bacterium]|nr:bifunctional UDP-N-acetylglucosamine diphosphorylase/glucosamine-1-phosphate N-acetyltransferase GlmU [Gammaproteobacteria bacterium]MBL4729521.1 bifunctional UDP-N-acetylglucosamine diphosphorylase/glucosamine-1-phosphate N-acetyltransferase GlmU [Gammaproteobacteria bacterium]
MNLDIVILAAGRGTRMNSNIPKVLHKIGGDTMLGHVLGAARKLESNLIHIVVGYGAEQIKTQFGTDEELQWALQDKQLGTGHAVMQAMPKIDTTKSEKRVLILYGDVPLTNFSTLSKLVQQASENTLCILTLITDKPKGLGRIVRDDAGEITAIVEEKDANEKQKKIKEINTGIMVIPAAKLNTWLNSLGNDNAQGEYYLTDVVAMAAADDDCVISAMVIDDENEVQGVNDKAQLASLERQFQMNNAEQLLKAGVLLRDPSRIDVRGELDTGSDVEIDINAIFEGVVSLGNGVKIGANVIIKDSKIADNVSILPGSNIDGAEIGEGASVGPYARIRPGTVLKENTKIGNFVETKNAVIGKGSKASHLAYIGDAILGENVNIGAGTIFCNYDGVNKHKTIIGDNVFVGSNSVLVAPVTLADNTFVAAGSSINKDVPAKSLAIARGKQRNIPGWKRPTKK